METDFRYLKYEIHDRVVVITMNDPEHMNAINLVMRGELHAALSLAENDDDLRVIVLTGAGRAFCAGANVSNYGEKRPDDDPVSAERDEEHWEKHDVHSQYFDKYLGRWHKFDFWSNTQLLRLWDIHKPIIAAVNGPAMGVGFWYQLACDLTIASDRALFAQPEVRHAGPTTFLFAALCGWKHANRYALTGDHFDADEAYRIGMVNEVVPADELMDATMRLANRLAMIPESSLRLNKAIAMQGLKASGVQNGVLMNGTLSAILHASYGEERERLFEAQRDGGRKAFLAERDGPFYPEPFGPRSAKGLA